MSGRVIVIQESASLVGPILIAAGAVVAAILTVLTANWRHQKQLDHDREQRECEHIRNALDGSLTRVADAIESLSHYAALAEQYESERKGWASLDVKDQDEADRLGRKESSAEAAITDAMGSSGKMTDALRPDNVRLELRLLSTNPGIVSSHDALRARFDEWWALIHPPTDMTHRSKEEWAVVSAKADECGDAFLAFRRACRHWFEAHG